MKILIATPLYPPDDGGPATRARLLELAFPEHGTEVSVVSFSHFRHHPKGISHLLYAIALWRAAHGVDLIYALDPVSVGFSAALVALLARKPLVVCIVGDYAWEQGAQRAGVKENLDEFTKRTSYPLLVRVLRALQGWVARRAVRIIVPSYYLQGIIASWGIPTEKISVVYNAFDPQMTRESRSTLRTKLAVDGRLIVTAGRAVPWKGFPVLMDAVAELRAEFPDVTLVIAGSGDQSEYIAYAKKQGYDFVRFLGLLSHDELMEWVRAADCFALNTGYEGLSHLLLEAMALETPIVTTNVGGNTELLADGRGALVPHDDKDALTAALHDVLTDQDAAAKRTSKATQFVSAFTVSRMVEESLNILKEAAHP
ncbi:MAG: hypothetical protein A2845_03295 [Candidatus Lloydbacteria bacterium RIFCSPHIGHO2_01_FULL_49_22]|uniref:Glycosyltransferase subfamily 4-like N-terminal domain-containing protein n=1 Tax=Candidatus Lloydbacteria bacterium RIFCSPHIGHO2_01_FULL_49_22 TaxID=1798658 RepID=A0A1G2CWR1_9BACT|nr:MAG: hypothetical protein A2845_03295 [Candidatus Lloydbacteria bacterium RIFCSPHIGHO2_01_FULL_49_22]OGZ08956.1 MAG: hypothetical protein A3C14_03130 [Candidatus Lloydbacteria bacterium RIFCSPHIGHO2_02_FULL_50_18]